jgi:hypothetical protein
MDVGLECTRYLVSDPMVLPRGYVPFALCPAARGYPVV